MEAWLTGEWQRNSLWQLFLRPVSWLFLLVVTIRRAAFRAGLLKSYSVGVPVVIVGNISVGGTGKTPLVLALVEALAKKNMHCGIVTRGYQRARAESAIDNVIHVLPSTTDGDVVSDEATLLARRAGVPVYAGADRVAAANTLLRNHKEIDVILSDDGLQHYALRRDIEICVIDGLRGLGNGGLLPAGPLREPASRLHTVDVIVVNDCGEGKGGDTNTARFSTTTPAFEMTLANTLFINLKTDQRFDVRLALDTFGHSRLHALAGIGHPQKFFAHLTDLGFALAATQPFPDHHHYLATDMPGSDVEIILMTEKDAVKCGTFADERMWFVRVDAVLPNDFTDFVLKKISHWKADHVT